MKRAFDIRRVIGGLFTGYGLLLTAAGLAASDADLSKAQGVNVNLWAGLGMLAFGGLLLWLSRRPADPAPPGRAPGDGED
ncbi:hypothetical protein ABZ545_16110 [Streptomyces abikoensis]|uniref:LPXTG cell wall anchor domain-containing protein n=2 Tax=Streptomyces TaxID=1883 RepID=A0A3S9PI49_STRLT|nr:hypothetical protein [Streptomyces luteoverticillatus]AZQ71975.1 hypothetical protein EKH77_12830 [Streptomyces luteoverticillatus]